MVLIYDVRIEWCSKTDKYETLADDPKCIISKCDTDHYMNIYCTNICDKAGCDLCF